MNSDAVTRRSFLATSAGIVATLAVAAVPRGLLRADSRLDPAGVVYGRAGRRGIPAGTSTDPSRGEVILLDETVIEASHVNRLDILPGRSVLLSPDGSGGWSILYAEF